MSQLLRTHYPGRRRYAGRRGRRAARRVAGRWLAAATQLSGEGRQVEQVEQGVTPPLARGPVIEMLIPSTVDASLAPAGKHVASLFCQHFSYELPNAAAWDDVKQHAADLVIDTVNRYAPNFKAAVLGYQTWSPLDLEREFGLIGGDIFHGALTLDQLYSARPVLGYADYRGPLKRLYMCGAGTHPGGGVTGIPGHNAAREILKDYRRGLCA